MTVLVIEEARWIPIDTLASSTGLDARTIRNALTILARVEREATKRLEEAGFNVEEVNPVILEEDGRVYTGDWVGTIAVAESLINVITVKPKVENFDVILGDSLRGFELLGIRSPLPRLMQALRASGVFNAPGAAMAAELIWEWVTSRPPTPENLATAAYMLIAALRQVILAHPAPKPLKLLVAAPLLAVATHPTMIQALTRIHTAQPVLEAIEEAAAAARLSTIYPGGLNTLTMLLPTPKLFELAVLTRVVDTLTRLGYRVTEAQSFKVMLEYRGQQAVVYYNIAPRSTIVEALVGRKLKPDIAVETPHTLILLEAKYRRCNGRILNMGDALRIAAYIGDVKPDKLLVIHPCNKPHQRINDTIELVPYTKLDKILTTILEDDTPRARI